MPPQTDIVVELQAGRDLDALIAERVFGATIIERTDAMLIFYDVRAKLNGKHFTVNKYSTDIRAAWEVVEHFVKLDSDALYNELAEVAPLEGRTARDAALTICRAALAALS